MNSGFKFVFFFHFGECNNILKLTANIQLRMFSVEAQDLITEMEKKKKVRITA